MTKHQWHPFPEEIPEAGDYLVYCSNQTINFAYFSPQKNDFFAKAGWLFEVTHWMVLPNPPGDDDEAEEEAELESLPKKSVKSKPKAKPKVTKPKASVKKTKPAVEPLPEPELFDAGIADHA